MENLGFTAGENFLLFKSIIVLCAMLAILLAIKNWRKINWPNIILVSISGAMASLGIRHFPSFAFFALPFLVGTVFNLLPFRKIGSFVQTHLAYKFIVYLVGLGAAIIMLSPQWQNVRALGSGFGLGLLPDNNKSADFFINNGLKGPVFNDYDIGGYLIYHLYPSLLNPPPLAGEGRVGVVFVDNRPEAYTTDFFENIYKAAQQDENKLKELDKKYNFNTIFFSHRDYTPWAQAFLISRIQDTNWVPVFADSYNIILLKKNNENTKLIKKYYIPRENFRIRK